MLPACHVLPRLCALPNMLVEVSLQLATDLFTCRSMLQLETHARHVHIRWNMCALVASCCSGLHKLQDHMNAAQCDKNSCTCATKHGPTPSEIGIITGAAFTSTKRAASIQCCIHKPEAGCKHPVLDVLLAHSVCAQHLSSSQSTCRFFNAGQVAT